MSKLITVVGWIWLFLSPMASADPSLDHGVYLLNQDSTTPLTLQIGGRLQADAAGLFGNDALTNDAVVRRARLFLAGQLGFSFRLLTGWRGFSV